MGRDALGADLAGVFRKKPVEVEAVEREAVLAAGAGGVGWPVWVSRAWADGVLMLDGGGGLLVRVLEGSVVPVPPGSWVIRGVRGELYPCDGGVFAETYERVR